MKKTQNFIQVERTAEYYILEPNDKVHSILYVLHGYSQLPEFFIEHFKKLTDLGVLVVAPSGLSLSYQSEFSGRVGASWMTKHNRENEIRDYVNYLENLHKEMKLLYPCISDFSLLGFSQGTATASRWFANSLEKFKKLILVAGGIAEDLDMHLFTKRLSKSKLILLYGDKDPYVEQEQKEKQLKLLDEHTLNYNCEQFEGLHQIPKKELYELFKY